MYIVLDFEAAGYTEPYQGFMARVHLEGAHRQCGFTEPFTAEHPGAIIIPDVVASLIKEEAFCIHCRHAAANRENELITSQDLHAL